MWKKLEKSHRVTTEQQPEHVKLARMNIYKQAGLAVIAIAVTMVLVFAMSVAWYSNVIHTEDMVFKTASWDFDFEGQIQLGTDEQPAAPGDNGYVYLELTNTSTDPIAILVNVTKNTTALSEEMKQRLYFYVDDTQTINDEVVDRIYINESEEYQYTILGNSTLVMTEDYHNAPPLCWEWVYDVLGYYVKGTMTDGNMVVEDYLRPISYDCEKATYDEDDEEGAKLLTIDGKITTEEFVKQLLSNDGYQGSEYQEPVNGYYPVNVDENGRGVWIYLCNRGQIEIANNWDTAISNMVANGTEYVFSARLLISGQQATQTSAVAYSSAELATQLNDPNVGNVLIDGDFAITDPITITGEKQVVLNLQENALTMPSDSSAFIVEAGSSLTIVNGTLTGNNNKEVAVSTVGGEINLSNVTITDAYRGVVVRDDDGTGLDSRTVISGCTINTKDMAVYVRGNAEVSSRESYLLIENSTLTSEDYIALSGNGSAWGTDIRIHKSTLSGKWAGIYQPQHNSTTEIIDSTIEGYTALAIKGGNVYIENSQIHGTGAQGTPSFGGSGFSDTGDGIYVETNYEVDICVEVTGDNTTVISDKSYAIQVYEPTAAHAEVIVSGGKYSHDITAFLAKGYSAAQEGGTNYYIVGQTPATETIETQE